MYYWFIFGRLAFRSEKNQTHPNSIAHEAVSVVISARNEFHHLEHFFTFDSGARLS